ncbi:GGDEF domain-containing protein [Stappia sp. WLB 29]|uniref:putative bifunctional diguanylate cyclase/phosphodiesterase n=1 Tax=Stappia sp. WLB 29 TaxID=2925220 RepID=UPI0020C18438|nr:GGDEF domain-containing protein [Stappia sp. WLB 29]
MRRPDSLIGRLRFSNWPVTAKVMAAPLVSLIALAAMTLLAWQALTTQRAAIITNLSRLEAVLDRAYEVSHHLASVEANLYKLSMWSEIGVRGAELEATLRSINYGLERAATDIAMLEDAELEGVDKLREAFGIYRQNTSQAVLLILRNATLGAVATRGGHKTYAEVEAQAQSLGHRASEQFRQATEEAAATSDRLIRNFVILSLLGAFVAVAASIAASRAIIRPVTGLVRTIRALLQGDLSTPVPHTARRDEIGSIAVSVQELQRALVSNRELAQEREQKQAELEFIAAHDGLTGVANRKAFDAYLDTTARAIGPDGELIFLLVDLDSFKPINDAYGHEAGDTVLKVLAQRYRNLVRPGDMVARLGGDEFAIVIVSQEGSRDPEQFAKRVLETTVNPMRHGPRELRVGASIGVAGSQSVPGGPQALMAAADRAMYVAKQEKRPSYAVYSPQMAPQRYGLEDKEEIERALREGEFVLHYQPKVTLADNVHAGFEALARWRHPQRGLLTPDKFLPRIDSFGLQADFTMQMARQAVADLKRFAELGLDSGGVSLNLEESMLATRSGMDELRRLVMENQPLARRITLEITEDVFIARAAETIRDNVDMLAALGIRISMDDFGTGYGSFKHLREFTIHELKIDREFVHGIGRDRSAEVIIDGFLAIASGLGAVVVAEGIETRAQARYLVQRGCQFGQGFLFCRPLPFEAAVDYLADRQPHSCAG